jgi:hypothetical protein
MTHWNYRVLRYDGVDGDYFVIDEVHYDDAGNPRSHTEAGCTIGSDSHDGLNWILDRMREAVSKPILDAANWPNEFGLPMAKNGHR